MIIGLGLGADDYVTKPFGLGGLAVRVRAMLRRYLYFNRNSANDTSTASIIRHGDIVLNDQTYEVEVGTSKVALTAKEFDILKLLLSYLSRVFTKSQIYQAIWKSNLGV
ncbi:response regulator transcription factor [Paenibacillus contaminans]|nr:response regulator transcription factor [Paenibacillus contaminans]